MYYVLGWETCNGYNTTFQHLRKGPQTAFYEIIPSNSLVTYVAQIKFDWKKWRHKLQYDVRDYKLREHHTGASF